MCATFLCLSILLLIAFCCPILLGLTPGVTDFSLSQTASAIMKFMIDNFGVFNLFGRDNYEYYARITGRVLKVEENWIFAFKYPPENIVPSKHWPDSTLLDLILKLANQKTNLQSSSIFLFLPPSLSLSYLHGFLGGGGNLEGKTSLKAEREWLNCETQKWSLPPMGLSRQLKGLPVLFLPKLFFL